MRVDAARALGLGHVKRCLAVAHALRTAGAEVRFFWRRIDVDVDPIVRREGFEAEAIGAGPVAAEEQDAAQFLAAARRFEPDVVLVDHYDLSASWHRLAGDDGARRVAIDDLADRALDVDLVIDHNFSDDHRQKYRGRVSDGTPILGGPRFAMLGPAYAAAARYEPQAEVRSLGIFMGGADAAGLSLLAWQACRRDAGFEGRIEIATTSENPHLERLADTSREDGGTELLLDAPTLAGFFGRHDLHVGAGGGATWERCCIGAPTLAVIAADNQRPVVLPLARLDVLEVVDTPVSRAAIARATVALAKDPRRRAALSAASRALVDGLGATRIAERIYEP